MRTKSFWVGLFTMMSASLANAAPITLPSDLAPGSTYFLAFVTTGTSDATSSNIADYDAFVTAEANLDRTLAALGTTWRVIGSTPTVDAITHIGVTGPVYNLAGQRVATGETDMFDGTLAAPIAYNQRGSFTSATVWTGSQASGVGYPDYELGPTNATHPIWGLSVETTSRWIISGESYEGIENHLYGISGPLVVPTVVPTEVPEPSTIGLMLGALLLLRGTHRRWRHRPATRTTQSDPVSH